MELLFKPANIDDIEAIYLLCKNLIDKYEDKSVIDYQKVLLWVKNKIEKSISEYQAIYYQGNRAGYVHCFINEDGIYEIDDLYIFDEFQNKTIGTTVIKQICEKCSQDVMLYVFIKNKRAVSLYRRLGFEIVKTVNNTRYIMVKSKAD